MRFSWLVWGGIRWGGGLGGRGRTGAGFGAEVSDQVGYFAVVEGIAKGRHLLTTVEDLVGDAGGRPALVFVDAGESGGLLGASQVGAMAESAAFIAEEGGSGLSGSLCICAKGVRHGCCRNEDGCKRDREKTADHRAIFARGMEGPGPSKGGDGVLHNACGPGASRDMKCTREY
jgi:hypothetical protein